MQKTNRQSASFDKEVLNNASHVDGLNYIATYAKSLVGAERCSIFIYNRKEDKLSTTLADREEKIIIPYDIGIVGETIRIKKTIIENEPYNNPNFLADVDMQTGYYTQNILTAPIFNTQREVIGALQLLNKKDGFGRKDVTTVSSFAESISSFIENAGGR